MKNVRIFINNYIGTSKVIRLIYTITKTMGKEEVYKEMMDTITRIHNTAPWGIINEFVNPIGIYIISGNIPNTNEKIRITSLIGKGIFFKRVFGIEGLENEKTYKFDGEKLIEV